MADFDFSTLVTDRSPSDLELLRDLLSTPMSDWTAEQLAAFNQAISKGAYNYTDLNRVTACMEYLDETLRAYGYRTGYRPIKIQHATESRLPGGYTELSYLYSTGAAYINTGISGVFKANFDIKFDPSSTRVLMGQGTGTGQYWGKDASNQPELGGGITISSDLTQRSTVTFEKTSSAAILTANNTTVQRASATTTSPFLLFRTGGSDWASYSGGIALYSCSFEQNGQQVLDLVPCENPDGELGFFDLINEEFYGNAGTGQFIPGSPINQRLPASYLQLEYIEATGNQFIDTGFKPNQNTRAVFNAYLQKRATGATYLISLSEYEPQAYFQVRIISSAQYLTSDFGNDTENLAEIPLPGRYVIDKNKNVCTVGPESVSNTATEFQSQSNLLLLAGTTTTGIRSASPGTIYACQIYDNGALVRNFVPCRDPTGNVGLYDLVGAQFYGNAGSGTFTAGPEVPQPEPTLDPYTWYEVDIPTVSTMEAYLGNVAALRSVLTLPEDTAQVPGNMAGLTPTEANQIEEILTVIGAYLEAMITVFRRCGAAICGGPGFYFLN